MLRLGGATLGFRHLLLAGLLLAFAGVAGEFAHLASHGHWVDHQHDLSVPAADGDAHPSLGHSHGASSALGLLLKGTDGPSALPTALSRAMLVDAGFVGQAAPPLAPFVPPRRLHPSRAPPRLA